VKLNSSLIQGQLMSGHKSSKFERD